MEDIAAHVEVDHIDRVEGVERDGADQRGVDLGLRSSTQWTDQLVEKRQVAERRLVAAVRNFAQAPVAGCCIAVAVEVDSLAYWKSFGFLVLEVAGEPDLGNMVPDLLVDPW